MQEYQQFGTIKRTVSRPTYQGPLWGDIQGLPPRAWCDRCGAEVYRAGEGLCRRCKGDENKGTDSSRVLGMTV